MGMLKKPCPGRRAASGVPWLCRSGSPDLGSPFCRLRAHRLAALRGVRAHVRSVRSARQNGCGLPSAQGRLDGPFGKDRFFSNIPYRCEPDRVYGMYVPGDVNCSTVPLFIIYCTPKGLTGGNVTSSWPKGTMGCSSFFFFSPVFSSASFCDRTLASIPMSSGGRGGPTTPHP